MKTLLYFLMAFVAYFAGMFAIQTGADVYADTIILESRAKILDRYNKDIEGRKYHSQILDGFLASSVQLEPKVRVEGQTAKITYLKNKVMTVATARSCTASGEQSGSGIDSLSVVTRMVQPKISKIQAAKNDYGYAGILANELWNAEKSLFLTGTNSIDAYLATQLATWVSSVNNGDTNDGTLNGTIMEIAKADIPRFYDIMRGHAMLNNYGEQEFIDIANSFWTSTHKSSNYTNITNTVDDAAIRNFMLKTSNRITPGAGYNSKHFIVPMGGIGLVFIDNTIFDGEDRGTYKRFKMESVLYPGVMLDVKHVKACADTSSDGGGVDDDVDTWQVSVSFAAFDTPLSAGSGETTVFDVRTLST